MNFDLSNLDLIDVLGERHLQLRKMTEKLWNDNNEVKFSNSEWLIMARIYKKQPTIAQVAKSVDISRQATHKFIKNLEAKGIVEISDAQHNKKEKNIQLTELGDTCYIKSKTLKTNLEKKIANEIGHEQLQTLRDILKKDWGV